MFYLFTGQPGAQKTANMIHFVMTDSQFQGRPVFFFNINACTVPNWVELSLEEVERWYELPEGSVILIDEGQELFRPQKWDKAKSETVTRLEKHRHKGYDILMTTQHPMLINADVRRQVQQHRHYKKPFGLKSSAQVWERCVDDPNDYHMKKEASSVSGSVPKEVFTLYKSTVLNTHKARPPKKLYFFAAALVGFIALAINFYLGMNDPSPTQPQTATSEASITDSITGFVKPAASAKAEEKGFQPFYPLDPTKYAQMFTPRIDGIPSSAPIYDELVKPTVAPKTRCFGFMRDGEYQCRCVTQQMTPVEMEYDQCVYVVNNGLWDPAPVTSATYNAQGQVM